MRFATRPAVRRRRALLAASVAALLGAPLVAGGWSSPTPQPGADRRRRPDRAGERADRAALAATSDSILAAFARGDADAAMVYHHPEVVKAFNVADSALRGRAAVRATRAGALRHARLEFVENRVESLLVHGDAAVELTRFAIRSTPRSAGDGAPTVSRGRTLVVYVRSAASPTGWVLVRELLQPAAD